MATTDLSILLDMIAATGGGDDTADPAGAHRDLLDLLAEVDAIDQTPAFADMAPLDADVAAITSAMQASMAPDATTTVVTIIANVMALADALDDLTSDAKALESGLRTKGQEIEAMIPSATIAALGVCTAAGKALRDRADAFVTTALDLAHAATAVTASAISERQTPRVVEDFRAMLDMVDTEATGLARQIAALGPALETQLLHIEAALRARIEQGVRSVTSSAQSAIEQQVVNLIRAEASSAAQAIVIGEALQVSLSTGPWLPAIHLAKIALDRLP
ncbi:hypothetical protein [Sphingomonas sp. Leaf25]|uniref:hypothetical protein n=1 Tax=Sphingomonas sp. Leaf25 TaxID=1735692 RepID=UPI0006FE6DCA|nr:hypothetical protein [Sphingomonas sp. Leaf25]KQN05181.1 hypothetical protein ASE78_16795 [Sphingomonas sp. Leaf25]